MRLTRFAVTTVLTGAMALVHPQVAAARQAGAAPAQAQPAPAQQPRRPTLAEGVVAIVNDEIISSYDLRQRMLLLMVTSGVQPTEENVRALQQQALRSLVDEHLQMQELARFEVEISDEDVTEEIAQIARGNNISAEQLLAGLAQVGVRPETLREQVRAQIGWERLVGGRYGSRVRIGDEQIDAAIQRIAASAAKPQYLVGEIFVDYATAGGQEAALNQANSLVQQLAQGAPFQAVARQFSNAASAASGGDAGWLIQGEINPPEVAAALDQMRPGQLSRPIPTQDGVWVVYLRDRRSGGADQVVRLKQAAIRLPAESTPEQIEAARAKLSTVRARITSCDTLEQQAAGDPQVVAGDLGEAAVSDLAPAFQDVALTLEVGQVSEPLRTQAGLHLIAVCARRAAGDNVPSRREVENRLYAQQVSLLARRYLRDLRNSATIETR
jgi:peptidyl-prolyl cis-trans isomerase SurA